MASNEGHIHWSRLADETVNYLGQELRLTSDVSNMAQTNVQAVDDDPIGIIRIRLDGSGVVGLALPTEGWEAIPGTDPVLEARVDANYPSDYIRVRQQ
jgi:hypothetical protein